MQRILDFSYGRENWIVINDGVMGGCSRGHWSLEEGVGVFSGALSLENNGGFTSVRSAPLASPPVGANAFRIRVRGDGRCYQFRVRPDNQYDGASYRAEFRTRAGEWEEFDLPLKEFQAVFRGMILRDFPPLTAASVTTVGFLLADKQPGEFRLEVAWIGLLTGDE